MAKQTQTVHDGEITVGPKGADVVGADNRAIQIALDAMAWRGGGTVRVLPGLYVLSDSIHLRSNVRLAGDRQKAVLKRAPMARSELAVDADIGQKQITPVDASGFRPGMGVMLRGRRGGGPGPTRPLTVTRVADGILYTNTYIVADHTADGESSVVNYFAMVRGYEVENAEVDGFTVDAAASDLTGIESVRIGGIMLTLCKHCTVRNVTVSNVLGDGILAEPSEHITVEDCESFGNTHHGVHFGSHSPWAKAIQCELHDNGSDGLYLCWGVREGMFRENKIHRNGFRLHRNGISLGHKDTDNLIERNHIYGNAKHGICFRKKMEANGAHRNVLRENVIENNGQPWDQVPEPLRADPRAELLYCGIFVNGVTHDLLLERNAIRETRKGEARLQANAVYLGPGVSRVTMVANTIEGHAGEAVVDESGADDNRLR
jgi:hypothetical protein